jgi:hypothetical protein
VTIDELFSVADDAGFVFLERPVELSQDVERGEVDEGLVIVEVREVLRGTEVLRGLVGRQVTVVSDDPDGIVQAEELVLFTDCVSLGDPVLVRELGRRSASGKSRREVDDVLALIAARPLAERIASAQLVVVGAVSDARRLNEPYRPTSEHDPDWWVARVAVAETLKGSTTRKNVDVLFANSEDIAWYAAPKLRPGDDGIFLLHTSDEGERPPDAPRRALVVTDPLDVQPLERRPRLDDALARLTEEG